MAAPTPRPASPYYKPMTLALTGVGLALTALLTLTFAQLPTEYSMWNASVIGALALFTAGRLGFWPGVGVTALAIALKDVCLYFTAAWWQPYPLSWVYFTGYVVMGWAFLQRSESISRIMTVALGSGLLFFFASNFVSWLEKALPQYEHSLAGLIDCYVSAIPFYRGTFVGDVAFSAVFFSAHAVLSRVYFPAERVNAAPERVGATENNW